VSFEPNSNNQKPLTVQWLARPEIKSPARTFDTPSAERQRVKAAAMLLRYLRIMEGFGIDSI
jgi:hypothetical protein